MQAIRNNPSPDSLPAAGGNGVLFQSGTPIVAGVCYGRCMVLAGGQALQETGLVHAADPAAEERLFQQCLALVRESLRAGARQVSEFLTEADEGIFSLYESLLEDPTLQDRVRKYLKEGLAFPSALGMASRSFQEEFQQIQDDYLRERLLDVQDVLLRLLEASRNLAGHDAAEETDPGEEEAADGFMPLILVAQELYPSQFLAAPLKRVCGIVCETGGPTSHAAILAHALRIPMLVDVPGIQDHVTARDKLLVDSRAGLCYANPPAAVLRQYKLALNISRRSRQSPAAVQKPPLDDSPATLDGTVVNLRGNITLFSEIPALHSVGIREVGLYRTEFMFLIRNASPDEDTQYRVLKRLVDGAEGAPVAIRTLDIGGDKPLPYIHWGFEQNPSLGWRGLRFLLTNPDFFRTHLRAILRASAAPNVKLLFPMISDVDDIRQAKAMVREAMESLDRDGVPHGTPSVGMMLELPSAALDLERLLPEVDFVSLGTNDLVQYLFAVDRGNSRVKQWYQQCHPIVLRLLGRICRTVSEFPGKELEICGEAAGDPALLPALLGAGLRVFSMNPAAIPNIRDRVRKLRLEDCQDLFQQACQADTPGEVRRLLDDFAESVK